MNVKLFCMYALIFFILKSRKCYKFFLLVIFFFLSKMICINDIMPLLNYKINKLFYRLVYSYKVNLWQRFTILVCISVNNSICYTYV